MPLMGLSIYGLGVGVMVGIAVSVGRIVGVTLGMIIVAVEIVVGVAVGISVGVAVGVLLICLPPVHAHRHRILIVQRNIKGFFISIPPGQE